MNEELQNFKGKIVVLAGSSKFKKEFIEVTKILTLHGCIVIPLGIYSHYDNIELTEEQEKQCFENQLKKIRMSDILFVIDKDKYIGENTKKEIKYAEDLNIPVYYMENIDNNRTSYPLNENLVEKDWEWFFNTGLLLQVNQILHMFGIALVRKFDDYKNLVKVYPARTKFRGFGEKSIDKSYENVTKYLSENIQDIKEDLK